MKTHLKVQPKLHNTSYNFWKLTLKSNKNHNTSRRFMVQLDKNKNKSQQILYDSSHS
jgi:hypothetical protein